MSFVTLKKKTLQNVCKCLLYIPFLGREILSKQGTTSSIQREHRVSTEKKKRRRNIDLISVYKKIYEVSITMTFFFKTDKSVILITTKCFGKFAALTAGTGVRRGGRQLTPLVR
jgi:hypothetical protein